MSRQRILVAALLLGAAALAAWLVLAPRFRPAETLTGYIEGEPLYLAAPQSGTVRQVAVRRGDRVSAGQPLFVVDPRQGEAQAAGAQAEVAAAQAQAEDARKGQRPVELAVFDAQVLAAEAQAREAEATLRRVRPLAEKGFYSRAALDDAVAAARTAEAEVAAARKRRQAAALGAREDQLRAADSRVRQAEAGLSAASARLSDLSPVAPAAARVEDVFFQAGEWAIANQPVVSLLPDDRIKVRFFAPQKTVAAYAVGRTVRFACDGCPPGLTATVTYVSPRAEFTPPVIYSREARDRLVYLIEARPSRLLPPGLPVDVEPLP